MDVHLPKGVSRETLLAVVRGWYECDAEAEPVHTGTVAEHLDLADSVSRQTRFLESLGVLDAADQAHYLTDAGARLGGQLAAEDYAGACETLRELLADWPLTAALEETLDGRPLSEAAVVAELAARVGVEPEGRMRTGLTTLLDCYVWTGLVERRDGRLALPEDRGRADDAVGPDADRETLRVGLELSVDLDPEDLEGVVGALRRGLAGDQDEVPSLSADVEVGEEGAEVDVVPGSADDGTVSGEPTAGETDEE